MHRFSEYQSLFASEYAKFMDFFKSKTGVHWQDRVTMAGVRTDPELFHYTPPVSRVCLTGWQVIVRG